MKREIVQKPIRHVTALWQHLVEPTDSVHTLEQRQHSQLLASLMLAIVVLVAVLIGLSALFSPVPIWQKSRFLFDLLVMGAGVILYFLSRRGHNRLVAQLFVLVGTIAIFSWVIYYGADVGIYMLYYLTAVIIFSALFLRARAALLVLTIYVIVTLLIPWQTFEISWHSVIQGPFAFNLSLGLLAVLVVAHYRRLESKRQTRLIESETQLRNLVENLRDVVYTHSVGGEILSLNNVTEELLGIPREEMIGKSVAEFIHPDDLPWATDMFRLALKGETPPLFEVRLLTRSDNFLWAEVKTAPVTENGRLVYMSGVARDITARKYMEAALRESEERYRIISESISDYAYAMRILPDGNRNFEWATDTFKTITGYTPDELYINHISSLYHPDDAEAAFQHVQQVMRGQPVTGEYRIITKDRQVRWIHIHRRPVWDEQRQRVVRYYGVAQDITGRKAAETRDLQLTLQRERLKLLGQFVDAISHDFRTSLTNIENSRYLTQRLLSDNERQKVQPKLDLIKTYVTRLNTQLDNLYTVCAATNPNTVPCDVNSMVESLIEEAEPAARKKGANLRFHRASSLPAIAANGAELKEAILHLITNAITYVSEGGTVRVNTALKNEAILIEVEDDGAGIAPEHQPFIFDLFYRADASRKIESGGIGVGLSIVKMVVEAHGGQITVESVAGEGTCFTIALPLAQLETPTHADELPQRKASNEWS